MRSGETARVLYRTAGGDQCRASSVPTLRDDPRDGTADGHGPRHCRACSERIQAWTAVCRVGGAGTTATLHGWQGAVVGDQHTRGCLSAQAPRPRSPGNAAGGGRKADRRSQWLRGRLERRGKKKTAVALANTNARIAWVLLTTDQVYILEAVAA